uniref:MYND-type domain-containing protein n=1 Tax=Chromera velia CCMP2878 TaxID=1169474 RepID=A0A0G4I5Z6_9ALVE|eukprot:Cvel_11276.t1-p1 / transcript=Cvel_11276.t1 / gene=Cvel_11276 / organism=Chromera_velia_CCMP2878 / gene_product=hypothetical protein / transcript_product=hypothetical protein / location=Cvel_scaffold703:49529-51016(+) / protein_length=496 / sequence_SO=supercontig / SO=protein_coding / is_pseudo=false
MTVMFPSATDLKETGGPVFDVEHGRLVSGLCRSLYNKVFEMKDSVPTQDLLAVKSFLATALKFFDFWSVFGPERFSVESMECEGGEAGLIMLSALLLGKGNERFRSLLWQSSRFRRGLKNLIQKLRVSRKRAEDLHPVILFFDYLQTNSDAETTFIPEEAIIAFNNEPSSLSNRDDPNPLDVSHLLRAFFWMAESPACAQSSYSNGGPNRTLLFWAVAAAVLRDLSLRTEFPKAARRAFADSGANADALRLFKLATSSWEDDESCNASASLAHLSVRLLAIECTLPNLAVAKYVKKKRVKLVATMRKALDKIPSEKKGGDSEVSLRLAYFIAWLNEGTFMSIELRKVPAGELFALLEVAKTEVSSSTGWGIPDSFQPTKKEKREDTPIPCVVCGARVLTFMYCAVCKLVVYCGKECQRKDWKRKPGGHKERCTLLKENVTDVLLNESNGSAGKAATSEAVKGSERDAGKTKKEDATSDHMVNATSPRVSEPVLLPN